MRAYPRRGLADVVGWPLADAPRGHPSVECPPVVLHALLDINYQRLVTYGISQAAQRPCKWHTTPAGLALKLLNGSPR